MILLLADNMLLFLTILMQSNWNLLEVLPVANNTIFKLTEHVNVLKNKMDTEKYI